MNRIKGLIIKDFLNLKTYRVTALFILILFATVSFINDDILSFIPIFIPLCAGMIGISSFNYDNITKSDRYILTFPVSRKDMVKSRYLYIFFITVIGEVLAVLLSIILQSIKQQSLVNVIEVLSISLGTFCGIMILQIFEIPIMYKFGAEKGRIIQMFTIVAIAFLISGVAISFIKISSISLEEFLYIMQKYGLIILTLVDIFLYFLSYKVSVKIFSKKEV